MNKNSAGFNWRFIGVIKKIDPLTCEEGGPKNG
jgi:hypothetical protein